MMNSYCSLFIFLAVVSWSKIKFASGQCPPLLMEFAKPNYENYMGTDPEAMKNIIFQKRIYENCGQKKVCYSPSDTPSSTSCIKSNNCFLAAAFASPNEREGDSDTEIIVELIGFAEKWIAIAFAPDPLDKENAYQIECVKEGSGPTLAKWESYYNFLKQYQKRRDIAAANSLARLIDSNTVNGILYCKFAIKKIFKNSDFQYLFSQSKYSLLFSRGNAATDGISGNLQFDLECTDFPEWTGGMIRLGDTAGPNGAQRQMILLHGTYMIVAFIGLIPIGGFCTRYYKALFSKDTSFLEMPIWLWVHILFEAVAIFVMYTSLGFIAESRGTALTRKLHDWSFHGLLGIMICSFHLAFFMFFMIFRTKTVKPFRWTFRFILHQGSGHFMFLFTLYLLNTTHWMQSSGMTCISTLLIRIWTIFYFFAHVIMTLYFTWVDKLEVFGKGWAKIKVSNKLSPYNTLFQPSYQVNDQPLRKFREYLLLLFVIITIIFGVLLHYSLDNTTSHFYSCRSKWYSFII